MRPSRFASTALGALASAALLAGCGSSSDSSSSAAPATTPVAVAPAAAVRDAQAKTATGSSKIDLTTAADVAGTQQSVKGTGAFDYAAKKGTFTLELGAMGGGALQERIVDGVLYLSPPGQATTFYSLPLKDLAGTPLAGTADPSSALATLDGVTDDVREVGKEQVRDAETTHYTATVDVAKLAAAGGSASSKALTDSGVATVPVEVWVDAEGRARRVVSKVSIPASAKTNNMPVDTTTTIELYDFGTPVSVTAPPKSQVKDGTPLLKQLKARGTSGA